MNVEAFAVLAVTKIRVERQTRRQARFVACCGTSGRNTQVIALPFLHSPNRFISIWSFLAFRGSRKKLAQLAGEPGQVLGG
jgi:hypothetical protein